MSETSSISILAEKCQQCPKVSACNEKRMEMCAYILSGGSQNIIKELAYIPNIANIGISADKMAEVNMSDVVNEINKVINVNCEFKSMR